MADEHETTDVDVRAIFGFGAGLVAVAVTVHVLVWLLFVYFTAREASRVPLQYPLAMTQEERLPPEPRLQTTPRQDLTDLRNEEEELLTTYRWVNKDTGTVRIPIEEAMRLTVERGLPARQAPRGQQ